MKTMTRIARYFALVVFAFIAFGLWCQKSHPDWGWQDCYGLHHENDGQIGQSPENQAKFRALDPKLQQELLARWDPKERARLGRLSDKQVKELRKLEARVERNMIVYGNIYGPRGGQQ
jgi:hypothetical protein